MNLRDTLLAALARLPGTREFHLHVLTTLPHQTTSLFPFATPKPRAHAQDILILLSEQHSASSPRKLVAALEARVYTLPSTRSAILYVSKVDTTGHAQAPSPTYTLARTVIAFYADPATRPLSGVEHVWVHLFARAQGQYLFPNSAEYKGKRPLSDVRLCAWWKRVFGDVAQGLMGEGTATDAKVGLYYVLPGYGEMEAVQALKRASSGEEETGIIGWNYGHPYSQKEITLPCPPPGEGGNLGHYIPSFEDDPKSRFMEEIGGGGRKRKRTEEVCKVSVEEFWERMSFRQECVAGAVTGFFTLGITSAGSRCDTEAGQVTLQVKTRIQTTLTRNVEFSTEERTIRGTEIVEGTISGLCVGLIRTIYGRVVGNNGPAVEEKKTERGPEVRMLTARKKKKRM